MTRLGHKVSMYSMIVMGVCCVQIYIMISLMKQTEPQGASARISMLSIGAQVTIIYYPLLLPLRP